MQAHLRPYITIRFAMSLDGCLDDKSPQRLILSNSTDFDLVDQLRAKCDAILVGGNTVRKDNPSLKIKSSLYQKEFFKRTDKVQPIRITCTESGNFDLKSKFFDDERSSKIIFTPQESFLHCKQRLGVAVDVRALPAENFFSHLLNDLSQLGISHVLVEGGASLITQLINQELFDDLIISVAPLILGSQGAPFFLQSSQIDQPLRNLQLKAVQDIDGMLLCHYTKKEVS
jgi:riboflavin-specific deaminase-like protein